MSHVSQAVLTNGERPSRFWSSFRVSRPRLVPARLDFVPVTCANRCVSQNPCVSPFGSVDANTESPVERDSLLHHSPSGLGVIKKKQRKEKASATLFRAERLRIDQRQVDLNRNILDSPGYYSPKPQVDAAERVRKRVRGCRQPVATLCAAAVLQGYLASRKTPSS